MFGVSLGFLRSVEMSSAVGRDFNCCLLGLFASLEDFSCFLDLDLS